MKRLFILLLITLSLFFCISACHCPKVKGRCFLCQGVPRGVPCAVNLHTGDVAELSPGGYGHMSYASIGGVTVIGYNGERCTAMLSAVGEDMDPALFCDDCRELIAQITNAGYILSDLRDISDISLYPIEIGATFTIGEYIVSVAEDDNGNICISSYRNDS